MNEAIWPIFIAAPFISPRVEAIFRAVSMWRVSSLSWAFSSERTTFAAAVPAYRVACPPIAVPSFAARPVRVWGILPSCRSGSGGSDRGRLRRSARRTSTAQLWLWPSRSGSSTRSVSRSLPMVSRHFLSCRPSVPCLFPRADAASAATQMAQDRTTLKVSPRDTFGTRATRRLRRDGLVPGVVYGQGGEARPFQVPFRELRTVLQEGQTLLDLELEGSAAVPVVIKEQQHHPVRGEVTHLDCLEVRLDEEIQAEVTIELEGTENAPGVREGGVLEHVTREITVEALPTEIPEQIVVDVSAMEINDTINLASVAIPSSVKLMAEELEEITIATLSPPRVEEEPEPELEEEAELVGEGEEGAEGEEGDEGEAAEGEAAEGDDSGGGDDDSGGE